MPTGPNPLPVAALAGPSLGIVPALAGQLDQMTDAGGAIAPTSKSTAGSAAFGQVLFTYATAQSLTSGFTTPTIVTPPSGTNPLTLSTYLGGFITDLYVGSNSATPFAVTVYSGATPIFYGSCKGDTGPINLLGFETQPMVTPGQALTVQLATASATTGYLYIAGFYQ